MLEVFELNYVYRKRCSLSDIDECFDHFENSEKIVGGLQFVASLYRFCKNVLDVVN